MQPSRTTLRWIRYRSGQGDTPPGGSPFRLALYLLLGAVLGFLAGGAFQSLPEAAAAETVHGMRLTCSVKGTVTGDDGARKQVDWEVTKRLSDGTGDDQIELIWEDQSRALNATSEDLDLDGGLNDFQGASLTFSNIGLVAFENLDTDSGDSFAVGGASSNQWTGLFVDGSDKIDVGPGGFFIYYSGVDPAGVTASTGDLLKVASVDNSTYRLILGGQD